MPDIIEQLPSGHDDDRGMTMHDATIMALAHIGCEERFPDPELSIDEEMLEDLELLVQ